MLSETFRRHNNEQPEAVTALEKKKANRELGSTGRNVAFKIKEIVMPLFQSPVAPHLEYAVQVCSRDSVKNEKSSNLYIGELQNLYCLLEINLIMLG